MIRFSKWKNLSGVSTGLSMMLVCLCVTGFDSYAQSVKSTPQTGIMAFQGSQFVAFISQLELLPESERDKAVNKYIISFPQTPVIEHDSIVSLYWYGEACHVMINGDYQSGWSMPDTMEPILCRKNTFFHKTYSIPSDARLDYQLIIDSISMTDPRNPAITPSGYGPHSEIAMPGFKPDPASQYRKNVPHGTIDSMLFTSRDPSIRQRQVKVYIPAGYEALSRLPVLYVLDGLEAMEYMSYPKVLDNLIADRKIGAVLVVFIPPAERHTEYFGDKYRAFMKALCNELVPLIDQTYRTAAQPGKRGITGISSGGHLALLTVLSRPDVFLCGAGQSPTLSQHIYKALHSLATSVKTSPDLRIYFDVGRFDLPAGSFNNRSFSEAAEELHREMEQDEIKHVFHIFNDGHEWANWRERTSEIVLYFFEADR